MSLICIISQYKSSSVQELKHMLYNNGNERERVRGKRRREGGRGRENSIKEGRQDGEQFFSQNSFPYKRLKGNMSRYIISLTPAVQISSVSLSSLACECCLWGAPLSKLPLPHWEQSFTESSQCQTALKNSSLFIH